MTNNTPKWAIGFKEKFETETGYVDNPIDLIIDFIESTILPQARKEIVEEVLEIIKKRRDDSKSHEYDFACDDIKSDCLQLLPIKEKE